MKKTILILIAFLYSAIGQARYYKAILYMQDGSKKTGLAKFVEQKDSKVLFKLDENALQEKIPSEELIRVVYTSNSGQIVTMDYLYLTSAGVFSGKYSKSKKKRWFNIIYDKEYKIGKIEDEGSNKTNNFRAASSFYYFGKNGGDELIFGFNTLGNIIKSSGTDATIKKMAKEGFSDCNDMIKAIDKETFILKTALDQVISIFDTVKCK